jgi:SAM-dependent methyltransferase
MAHDEFYKLADYYDIAFQYRDVPGEVSFFEGCVARHGDGKPLTSVMELCSGPGYHALEFARRGVRAGALDLSPEMVQRALANAAAEGFTLEGIVANMTEFVVDKPYDLALNLLTSISYLLSNEDLLAHFAAVAQSLRAGGIYIVENNHPRDFWSGDHFKPSNWTETRDGITVETTWCAVPPKLHLVDQTYEVTARYRINDHGTERTFEDHGTLRMLLPQEMKALAATQGLEWRGSYGSLDLDLPLTDDERCWRNVSVFQKRA